jgi:lysophospholipase L1-like esterase
MKKLVCFSIIYVSLISCAKKNEGTFVNPATILDTIHKSYLALGDSYTIGESVADTDKFPVQTVRLLREQNIEINNPDIIATSGWTTTNLLNALNNSPPKKIYSVVSLLIGVNNQYQGKTLEEYTIEFTTLMNMAISYAGNIKSHVFILSIPDYSVTPFASGADTAKIAREIDAFNTVNKNISLNAGVHYLDITAISRDAKNDPTLIAGDGLHPSAVQYKKWSEILALAMLKELD